MTALIRTIALFLVAGLAGGAVAVATGAGDGGSSPATTVVRTVTPRPSNVAATKAAGGLSAAAIYRRDAPGVVVVTATTVQTQQNPLDPFGAPQQQQAQSLGSGFVIDHAGHILTNAHVVLGARKVQVGFSNGKTYDARVVGTDKATDVAVLQVDVPASALRPLTLASAKGVVVGDPVVAIGNPLGEERTITSGIISAVSREITSLQPGVQIYGALQTDAAINHGNSGGPLIDARGRVIGITSQILSENNGNVGIGFAIPIDTARRVADELISTGKAQHTYVGVEGNEITPDIAKALNLPSTYGVLVGRVVPGSPAAKAGLRGGRTQATVAGQTLTLGGDVIVAVDGKPVRTFADLAETVAAKSPGDHLKMTYLRGGARHTVDVTLAARKG